MTPISLGIFASANTTVGTSFESIATATGTGSSGSVTFSNIPGTFAHLQLRFITRNDTSSGTSRDILLRLNGASATGTYKTHSLRGDGATVTADTDAQGGNGTQFWVGASPNSSATTNTFSATVIDILDYANTNKNTTVRSLGGNDMNGSGNINFHSALYLATTAITSIEIYAGAGNWVTGSHFALYGIKGA